MEVAEAVNRRHAGPSEEDLRKAPKWEQASGRPGSSEGQVCVFNKQGKLIAAQWSMASLTWIEMGEVVGSAGDQESINGVPYDMVLPVEVDTAGGPVSMKLGTLRSSAMLTELTMVNIGYNNGENPFVAAQRFIDQNGLQQSYLQEIADWIIQRTGQQTPTFDLSAPKANAGVQPLVGLPSNTSANASANRRLPFRIMYFFSDVPNGLQSKLVSKLQDLNSTAPPAQALTSNEFDCVVTLAATLENTSRYHASEISSIEVAAAVKMLHWSPNNLAIPFDLMRMLASHPHGAETLARHSQFKSVLLKIPNLLLDATLSITVSTVIFRFLTNCIRNGSLMKTCLLSEENAKLLSNILEASKAFIASGNKNYRISLGSLLANIAVTLGDIPSEKISFISELYIRVQFISRVLFRADPNKDIILICALAIGTLAFHAKQRSIIPELYSDLAIISQEFTNLNDSCGTTAPLSNDLDETLAEIRLMIA